ncbi:hypothetical protein AAG906_020882 [Vitis piasezkii]
MWWNRNCLCITFSYFRPHILQKIKFKFANYQESDNLGVVDFTFNNFFSVLFIINQVEIL